MKVMNRRMEENTIAAGQREREDHWVETAAGRRCERECWMGMR